MPGSPATSLTSRRPVHRARASVHRVRRRFGHGVMGLDALLTGLAGRPVMAAQPILDGVPGASARLGPLRLWAPALFSERLAGRRIAAPDPQDRRVPRVMRAGRGRGLMSSHRRPSIASRALTSIRSPSRATMRARCRPMGFGRLGEQVPNTPVSGWLMSSSGCVLSSSRAVAGEAGTATIATARAAPASAAPAGSIEIAA